MREDGALTGVIPSPDWGYNWGPVCDCMLYELPYRFYLYTGDDEMLKSGIEYFDRYIGYLEKSFIDGYDFILGDWLGYGSNPNVPKQFIWEFYLIKAYTVTAFAYKRAGLDNSKHLEMLDKLRKEFISKYIQADGRCTITDQTSVAIVIMNELYTDKNAVCSQLANLVENGDGSLKTGMVGVQYIYDALSVADRPDLAFKMITESSPGYKNWYENGATTLWELWNGKEKYSHNHHMFSAVIGWFFKSLLGIQPKLCAPAFEEIELTPRFVKEAGYAKGEMQTEKGKIAIDWKYEDGKFVYSVEIPGGINATYNGKKLSAGKNEFIIKNKE
jgi:alpha-L-rhamnosidase